MTRSHQSLGRNFDTIHAIKKSEFLSDNKQIVKKGVDTFQAALMGAVLYYSFSNLNVHYQCFSTFFLRS